MKPKLLKTDDLILFLQSDVLDVCINDWSEYTIRAYNITGKLRDRGKLFTLTADAFKIFEAYDDGETSFDKTVTDLTTLVRKETIDEILKSIK